MIRCIFCDEELTNVEGLRTHSRDCEKHPAVAEVERLRAEVQKLKRELRDAQYGDIYWGRE